MSYKIVVDSSSNLKNDYLKDQDIGFEVVPLTIRVDDEIFVDNDNIDVDKMLTSMHKSKKKSTSACPSPYDFLKTFEGYDNIFIITISSKLSGCYNSAINAGQQAQNEGKNVYVIDSKATAGSMILLVDEVYRLIKENYSFEEIKTKIEEYQKSINLLFVLSKYDNLVKKIDLKDEEIEYWKKIIENMYFPYDEKRGVYPLDDGFMKRKHWDDSKIPKEKRHLLYENYHPLFIFRQRMSKQADAILAMYLHSNLSKLF